MKSLTKQTLQKIRRFKVESGFVHSKEHVVFCPQVNGLTNICLAGLGFEEESKKNTLNFLNSCSFNTSRNLFHRETDSSRKIVVSAFNTCKNSVFALALAINGFEQQAKEIMESLWESPAHDRKTDLFIGEFDPFTGEVNPVIFVQSNLWVSWAFLALGDNQKAKTIMASLEKIKKTKDNSFFVSRDFRKTDNEERVFIDDQAIAALVFIKLGERQKAERLIQSVINSHLHDVKTGLFNSSFSDSDVDTTKSTYKNSFMAFALAKLGFFNELKRVQEGLVRDLYDVNERLFNQTTNDRTKVPDNSALALVALELRSSLVETQINNCKEVMKNEWITKNLGSR